jgi:uncharacterized protein (DUF427 family)
MRAIWNGTVIAESADTVVVERNHYFPADSMVAGVLTTSDHTSVCPWKGTARYHHLVLEGEQNNNAVWFYPEPKEAAAGIKGRLAFWKGVTVEP